jgi:hypothetical protein
MSPADSLRIVRQEAKIKQLKADNKCGRARERKAANAAARKDEESL